MTWTRFSAPTRFANQESGVRLTDKIIILPHIGLRHNPVNGIVSLQTLAPCTAELAGRARKGTGDGPATELILLRTFKFDVFRPILIPATVTSRTWLGGGRTAAGSTSTSAAA